MIQLVIYGVIAAVLMGGAYAVRSSIEDKGAAKQLAIDKPIIEACQAAKKVAEGANDSLRVDLAKLTAERDAQSEAVAELGERTKAALLEREKAIAFSRGQANVLKADADALRARLAKPPTKGASCEQTLTSIDGTLRELAVRRLRDHPPAAGGSGAGGSPAANQDPGSGSVRISP